MATTKAVFASAYKINGATVLKAGNVESGATRVTNALTIRSLVTYPRMENKPFLACSITSSGNVGGIKAYSGGTFAYTPSSNVSSTTPVEIIAKRVSTKISGVANTTLRSGAADTSARDFCHPFTGYRRLANTTAAGATFDIFVGGSGVMKKGSGAGVLTRPSGINNGINSNADHALLYTTFAVPGEFTWIETGKTPTQKNYAAKYSI